MKFGSLPSLLLLSVATFSFATILCELIAEETSADGAADSLLGDISDTSPDTTQQKYWAN